MPGDFMVSVNSNRTDETKRRKIPDKFINREFYDFLNNTFPLEEAHIERDLLRINGYNSDHEWADHYQLEEIYGITLNAILKLLNDKGCIKELTKMRTY